MHENKMTLKLDLTLNHLNLITMAELYLIKHYKEDASPRGKLYTREKFTEWIRRTIAHRGIDGADLLVSEYIEATDSELLEEWQDEYKTYENLAAHAEALVANIIYTI